MLSLLPSRREFLSVGAAAGLTLPAVLRADPDARAKACIVFFLTGGPPQHETWDPKPDAPAEVRGDAKPIATSVPGLRVGEWMPLTAKLAHRVCVLRAVSTDDNAHSSSGYWMLTGRPHQPMNNESSKPGPPNDAPSLGGIVHQLYPSPGRLPSAVTLPERIINNPNVPWPGQDGGYLGRSADPWLIPCDPSAPRFRIPALELPDDLPPLRFDERRSLVERFGSHLRGLESSPAVAKGDLYRQQAFDLIASPGVRRAFDLESESVAIRDRYGRSKVGQSLLLARRLVEAGVKLVQVNWPREPNDSNSGNPLWDTHSKNSERLRTALMPPMDQGYSALLADLDERGMLDTTVVLWTGEFGRTPRINGSGGRDHWGHVYSAALAGGGIKGGQVIGASDSIGGRPRDGRVAPHDVMATVLHALGIGTETMVRDVQGRPTPICGGSVIRGAI